DGEVRRDQAVAAGERGPQALVVLGGEAGRADDRVQPVLGHPLEVAPGRLDDREVDDDLGPDLEQDGGVGRDVEVGDVDARDLAEVEPRVVGVDGGHQLELGVAGHGPAHRAAHPAPGPEHSHAHCHRPGTLAAAPPGHSRWGRAAPATTRRRPRAGNRVGPAGGPRYRGRRCDDHGPHQRLRPPDPRVPGGAVPSSPLATLTARGLDVAAGPHVLLTGVDLVLAPGARVGLVGPNGAGKSTLLRTLAGLHPPESGTVTTAPPAATVGYLPQEPAPRPGETVRAMLARRTGVAAASAALDRATAELDEGDPSAIERYSRVLERWMALGGADLDARTATVAEEVGLGADLLDRPTAALSGGRAARAGLASLLLARYDVFLLDEPTNDLDLDGLERLERFVLGLRGPAVLVSHDRAFLERTVTAVAEIDAHARTLTRYEGGWHAYLEERARARRRAEERYA